MQASRISELLKPFLNPCHSDRSRSERDGAAEEPAVLSPTQLQSISTYIDLLKRWNARLNLTAIRDEEEIVSRHFGESLFAAAHLFPTPAGENVGTAAPGCPAEQSSATPAAITRSPTRRPTQTAAPSGRIEDAGTDRGRAALQGRAKEEEGSGALAPVVTVADLGSGAGFPGIPIKLWAPYIHLTLIESNHKKATFLRELIRALTLTNVDIQNARAETLPPQSFHVVTLRAVERFDAILPTAAKLLAPRGHLALLIGTTQEAQAKLTLPNFKWNDPLPLPGSLARTLLIGSSHQNVGEPNQ